MARQNNAVDDVRLADAAAVSGDLLEPLRSALAELGLSPYEVRVLLALLRLGSANTLQLARVTSVPRTSIYQVLESLASRRLASRLPGDGVAVFAAADRKDIFERLETALAAVHAERLSQHRDHAARASRLLAAWAPENAPVSQPYVHTLMLPAQVKSAYEQMLGSAERELLMFTRPPYAVAPGRPKDAVLDMMTRGVKARVLYQADKWEEPEAHAARQELSAYHAAGVEARLVDNLPIKLVVADRRVALVGMTDPVIPEGGYPMAILVEHPGYAATQADAFERMWATSRALTLMPTPDAASDPPDLSDLDQASDLRDIGF